MSVSAGSRAQVTVIIATYNRPQALQGALKTLLNQDFADWQALVIGDCCSETTGQTVAEFGDPRLFYINLPERCGEQSGPNSVGMALADTPFLAFLNHDDLWFPDHLSSGLRHLQRTGADLFAARSAFVSPLAAEGGRLVFQELSPVKRRLSRAFTHAAYYLEPTSSWILSRRACDRVGAWHASATLYRTPLEDWLLRAWRAGVRLVDTDHVTVIKPRLLDSTPADVHAYGQHPPELDAWAAAMATDSGQLRAQIHSDVARVASMGLSRSFQRPRGAPGSDADRLARQLTPLSALIYFLTGRDVMEQVCRDMGVKPGSVLRWALSRRTGETLRPRPPLDGLVAAARAQWVGMRHD